MTIMKAGHHCSVINRRRSVYDKNQRKESKDSYVFFCLCVFNSKTQRFSSLRLTISSIISNSTTTDDCWNSRSSRSSRRQCQRNAAMEEMTRNSAEVVKIELNSFKHIIQRLYDERTTMRAETGRTDSWITSGDFFEACNRCLAFCQSSDAHHSDFKRTLVRCIKSECYRFRPTCKHQVFNWVLFHFDSDIWAPIFNLA